MDVISNFLVLAAALGSAIYCIVLSRRLKRFTDLETGVGGAVAVLSAQVTDLENAISEAKKAAQDTRQITVERVARAEDVARRLEILVASVHDLDGPERKEAVS